MKTIKLTFNTGEIIQCSNVLDYKQDGKIFSFIVKLDDKSLSNQRHYNMDNMIDWRVY